MSIRDYLPCEQHCAVSRQSEQTGGECLETIADNLRGANIYCEGETIAELKEVQRRPEG